MSIKSKKITTVIASAVISFIFVQSLFFKFTNAPETQHIFNTLNDWAAGYGFEGLFVAPGVFNAYVIGTAELIASLFLLSALILKKPLLTAIGSIMAFGIISGAITFHLFTPLGINVQGDGGTLFGLAVAVWVSSIILIFLSRSTLCNLIGKCKETPPIIEDQAE